MSEEAKLQDSIKKTQDLLSKYVKKPPLTEKLLRKPPFRFLHDTINAVIKETGFLKGLFTDEELISSNITDKDGKLAYLTKLIDAMKLITGQELSVRPSKIVSGQEPLKTNELLQAIAKSLDKKISSSEAIEHYKKSLEKRERQKSKKSEEKPRKTSSEEKLRKFREAEEKRKSAASEEKPRREPSEEKNRKSTKKSTPSERTRSKDRERKEKEEKEDARRRKKPREESVDRKSHKQRDSDPSRKSKRSSPPKKAPEKAPEPKNEEELQSMEPSKDSTESIHEERPQGEEVAVPPQVLPPPEDPVIHQHQQGAEEPSAETVAQPLKTSEAPAGDVPAKRNLLRPPSARPPSARPGAPKLKGKGEFLVNTNGLTQMGDVHVIVENFDTREDDVEGMVVVESSGNEENLGGNSDLLNKELTKEHGYLVAQILETQRELVNEGNVEIIPNKVEIEWEAGMRKDKEAVVKEVDKLRGTIQSLTRTTNPLGKLMDFLQEDAEIMEKELWEWRSQFSDLREQLVVERNMMKESIKPLEESLKEIEGTIGGQMEKIFQTKANIMRNNQRIQKLLSGR
ncbi:TRAF3-interacting protein 1 [Diachasma alloeum]|uniref:TRAF3-interacting protein 1 n=1 Tax=Diachasma alloeum TaxID=454923 RepID=UPI00073818CA|nr:TRAF3-interacting protein 1 [Diachasma alloeum]